MQEHITDWPNLPSNLKVIPLKEDSQNALRMSLVNTAHLLVSGDQQCGEADTRHHQAA